MKRKSSREYPVVFLVEGEKFKLRNFLSRTSSLLSVLLRTRSVQRLSSQHFAAVLTPNIAELVPSGFFLSTTRAFAAVRTHFPRKNISMFRIDRHLVTEKEISGKIKFFSLRHRLWPSGVTPACAAGEPGSIPSGDMNFFFSFSFLFFSLFFI